MIKTNGHIERGLGRLKCASIESYIRTGRWKRFCKRYFGANRRIGLCRGCLRESELQLHHCTYERLGRELLDDVIPVCDECHKKIHAFLRERLPDCALDVQVLQTKNLFREIFGINMAWSARMVGGESKVKRKNDRVIRSPPVRFASDRKTQPWSLALVRGAA